MIQYDVIVVGAGSAGVIAALSSARSGAKTLLIEEASTFGGTNTNSLVGPLVPFLGENSKPIVAGIPQEVIDELMKVNASSGHRQDPIGFAHSLTPVDFRMMQVVQANLLLAETNLDIVLNESVVSLEKEATQITSLTTTNRTGKQTQYHAKQFIDASGDADVVAMSGADFEIGRESDGKVQPMTMVFSLANVDLDRVRDDVAANPDNFAVSDAIAQGERMDYVAVSGYFNEVRGSASFPIQRDRLLFFEGVQPGEVYVNTTRVLEKNNLDPKEFNEASLEGNRQVLALYRWMRENIPAFAQATLMDVGIIGVRESRRIVGRKQLQPIDVLSGAKQDKSIAVGSYPIDVHSPDSAQMEFLEENIVRNYEIDLEMLVPQSLDNLLVAGRAISATHEAHASSRVSVTCMAIGQAAGLVSALAAKKNQTPLDLEYSEIKERLNQMGGITEA